MNRRTVLLVDCDQARLTALGEMMAVEGYAVASCRDFEAGRRYLQTHAPHAIVTDVRLGDYNGLHLVLLARQKAPAITAVLYSGQEDSGIRQDAVFDGATYLAKETLRTSLLSHLNSHLGK